MKALSKTILTLYLLFLLWLVLFKFTLHIPHVFDTNVRAVNLIPFASKAGTAQTNLIGMVLNLLAFVPFGLLLSVVLRQSTFRRKLAYIFWFSVAIEITQLIFAIGVTDITDVIMNTGGGLLGLALYRFASGYVDREKLGRWTVGTIGTITVLLFALIFGAQYIHGRHRADALDNEGHSQLKVDNIHLAWPSAGEAAVADENTGQIALSSNDQQPQPTASMAKIITALAVIQKQPFSVGQDGQTYTITRANLESLKHYANEDGSVLPLRVGMRMTEYQALQRMLIASDDNMADVLATDVFGSQQAYLSYAQNMLKGMGLNETVVADASGYSANTVSTPTEIIELGIFALTNPVIADIVSQQQAQLPVLGTITNTNQLLGKDGVIGIKTGTTDQAGSCLLFAAHYMDSNEQQQTLVGVIMGDTDHPTLYNDAGRLLTSAEQGFGLGSARSSSESTVPTPRTSRTSRQ